MLINWRLARTKGVCNTRHLSQTRKDRTLNRGGVVAVRVLSAKVQTHRHLGRCAFLFHLIATPTTNQSRRRGQMRRCGGCRRGECRRRHEVVVLATGAYCHVGIGATRIFIRGPLCCVGAYRLKNDRKNNKSKIRKFAQTHLRQSVYLLTAENFP